MYTDHTDYVIVVSIGEVNWKVKHRYKDFQGLHQHLTANHGIAKHLLPPKKILGNKDPTFVERRRNDLQAYLQVGNQKPYKQWEILRAGMLFNKYHYCSPNEYFLWIL